MLGERQRDGVIEMEVGPVLVRVLGSDLGAGASAEAAQSAREFVQRRMAGVKRSAQMLLPARALQPAALRSRRR